MLNRVIYRYLNNEEINNKITLYTLLAYTFTLPISPLIAGKIFLLLLGIFLFSSNKIEKLKFAFENKVVQSLILFFVLHIIWMIGSDNIDVAKYEIKALLLLLYPLLFISIIRTEHIAKILITFLIAMTISLIWSYLIYFNIYDSPIRICSEAVPFLYKSDYGFFLAVVVSFVFYLILHSKLSRKTQIILSIFIGFGTLNVFMIGSKSAYFFYVMGVFIAFVMHYKVQKIKLIFLFLGLGSIYFIAYMEVDNFRQRIDIINNTVTNAVEQNNFNSSAGARYGMLLYSIPVIKENWLFGIGTGDHAVEIRNRIEQDYQTKIISGELGISDQYKELMRSMNIGKSSHLHNTYIQVLVQFGIIGLLIFLNIFFQIYRSKVPILELKVLQMIIVGTYLIIAISGADFMFNSTGKFFVFFIALTLINYHHDREKGPY